MKITNEELLIKFAEVQLKSIASFVLQKYVGDVYSVNKYEEWNFRFASSIHHSLQFHIDELGVSQKLKRLRALVPLHLTPYAPSQLQFYINNKQMHAAYHAAQEFYLGNSIPDCASKAIAVNNAKELIQECEDMLLNRFGGSYCVQEAA